ncbi:flagellar hook-associated protein FlgK [Aquipseudomonas campi]
MADLLSIGLSGLSANKTSLSVTGHNITNINTPGFSRQGTVQETRPPQFSGAGYIGQGTSLTDVRRFYSEFLTTQLRASTSLANEAAAYQSQIDQLDSLLAGTTTGISPSLKSFFAALQTASEDPANMPARQLVLAEADGLARRFNTVYDRLDQQNVSLNKQMSAVTDQINRLAGSIASLNDAIGRAASGGQQPNDLLDARDEAVRQLSAYIGVTVVTQDDGIQNIFIGSGQPLVLGGNANRLEVVPGANDPNRAEVQFVVGNSRQSITAQLQGGEMGGLLRYREDVLDTTYNSVGRLALAIADQINQQLGQGLDLKGEVGTALFKDFNEPGQAALRVLGNADNLGNSRPLLNITNSSILTTSDYRLEFDGTNYTARRLSDNEPMTVQNNPPGTLTLIDSKGRDQGFQIVMGTPPPMAGDTFQLQPTRRGATEIAKSLDQADQLAFAAPVRSESGQQNKGTGRITQPDLMAFGAGSNMAALKAALTPALSLTYDAATGNFTLPAGATMTRLDSSGAPAVPPEFQPGQDNLYEMTLADGSRVRFTLNGRPEDGDQFSVGFNQNGVSDNRNGLKLVNLQQKATVGLDASVSHIATGTNFSDGYGELIEYVGTRTAQARLDTDATTTILKQAQDSRDSLSGVNLDEEAANLIKFEQYYNASAQIIQVARSLFDTLISTFR